MKTTVIDTDPGTDDAIALMMALGSPELDILGLTTVGGNAPLAQTTRNALRVLEYMERPDVEVFRGSARPLRGRFHYAHYFHGPGGLTVRLPVPVTRPAPQRAVELLVERARAFRGEFTAIALGPLTNLARAIKKDRRLVDWTDEIVVMGGAVEVPGNVTAHAEFNIYNDPAAAEIVLFVRDSHQTHRPGRMRPGFCPAWRGMAVPRLTRRNPGTKNPGRLVCEPPGRRPVQPV